MARLASSRGNSLTLSGVPCSLANNYGTPDILNFNSRLLGRTIVVAARKPA